MEQSIAITGSGIICACGTDKDSVYDSLVNGKCGIDTIQYLNSCHKELPVGEVKMTNDELKSLLSIDLKQNVSRTTLLGAYALKQSLADAGLSVENLEGKRVAFISGTTVGGMDLTEQFYGSMITDDKALCYLNNYECGSCSKDIVKLCGLNAEIITISTACSSALNSIILGTRMLLNNEVDIVVGGGTEALSVFHLNGFNSLLILDKSRCRPFDRQRNGLNLGEGAAYVVLERSNDATKRGAHLYAYIAGFGNCCDAYHQTATSSNGEGAYLAMTEALRMAQLTPTCIDYINAHGTGTPNNDKSESAAVIRVFGENYPAVSSTKSFTGHTTSASGSIETVICTICMHHNFIPSNSELTQKDDECIVPFVGNNDKDLRYVMCNSFGFGGNDSTLILSKDKIVLPFRKTQVLSEIISECTITDKEDLKDLNKYVTPREQRRMDTLTKAALLTSYKALEKAGITCPDAIIIGTAKGMLSNSEKILQGITENGEDYTSPTLFMQCTHNILAGILAIRLKDHGYNITYSQGEDSFRLAVEDAKRLISEGTAKTVLVGIHDECTEQYASFLHRAGMTKIPEIYSKSVVISVK